MGNTNWRTEPTNVEKLADDLWLGVKGQSNRGVPPALLDWNMSLAARLPRVPGLRVGVVESNGPQNYTDWRRLDAMCAAPGAAWRTPQNGVYRLDGGFYGESGIFAPLPAYADTLRPV